MSSEEIEALGAVVELAQTIDQGVFSDESIIRCMEVKATESDNETIVTSFS